MLSGWPELWVLLRTLWDIVGPYILLQKHTSEITKKDIDLATTILNYYCGPLDQLDNDKFYKDVGLKALKLAKMPIVHLGWLKNYFSGYTGHSD